MPRMCISVELLSPASTEPSSERVRVWSTIVRGKAPAVAAMAGEEEEGGDDADDGGTSHGDADNLRCVVP